MINLDEINWNYLCEKYNEKNNQEDYDSAKKGLTTYLNTWNKLKTAWNSNRDNHLARLRLYSSLAPEMSITYFLRYFNRGNWCLGWCNPGSNPKFLTVSRVKNYKQEIYNVDGVIHSGVFPPPIENRSRGSWSRISAAVIGFRINPDAPVFHASRE